KLILLRVNLITSAVGERSLSGGNTLVGSRMIVVRPLGTVGINQVRAHVTLAVVQKEAPGVRAKLGKRASAAVFQGLFCQNELPRTNDAIADFRFALSAGQDGTGKQSQQG